MSVSNSSLLLIGESDTGKTHLGAQLLRRLSISEGELRMAGAATNLEPFESALESLSHGKAARHTPGTVYVESVWPVRTVTGGHANLIWPDYGGEQVRNIISSRRIPDAWRPRVNSADAWLLMIRLRHTRVPDDIFTKPLSDLSKVGISQRAVQTSDQARLIELLQMLSYIRKSMGSSKRNPQLCLLLSCWDEMPPGAAPENSLRERLPMFADFVETNWPRPLLFGLSALGRPLTPESNDPDYIAQGPEAFGFVVERDGKIASDLTIPITRLINGERPGEA